MKRFSILTLLLLAACSRGPDEAALTKHVEEQIAKSFKPGLIELAGVKRQGSGPLPEGRVVVYYNATLRLKEGYDFKDWEGMSPATLAQVLGGRERGVIGVKASENKAGDLLRVYGTGIYQRAGSDWTPVAGAQRDVSKAPAEPGSAAPSRESQRYLEQLASQVNIGPPGIDSRSDKIISEELEQALRAIARRRARTQELATVAAGPAGGEYARVVDAVLGTLSKRRGKVRALAIETEGSIENALLIGRGQADYGLVQSDIAWLAASGAGPFAVDGPFTKMVAFGSLYPEPVHIVVPAKSPIRSVEDLRGKRVDLGAPKSGSRINALALLQANRIQIKDLAEARGDGAAAAMQQMRVGQVDAFFVTIGAPAHELQRFAAAFPVRLLPVSAAAAARVVADQPGLVRINLPANTYPGQGEPVATIAATALLVGTSDMPADEVKAVLELTFEGVDYLGFGSAQGVRIAKNTGLRGIAIPLHPGAAAYFGKPAPKK